MNLEVKMVEKEVKFEKSSLNETTLHFYFFINFFGGAILVSALARQVLYHWNHTPIPLFILYYLLMYFKR
jgi:uncharacterized membrane protein YoaK (UPF0700 family)